MEYITILTNNSMREDLMEFAEKQWSDIYDALEIRNSEELLEDYTGYDCIIKELKEFDEMTELERVKQILKQMELMMFEATQIVDDFEKREEKNNSYPNVGQNYYYIRFVGSETIVEKNKWLGYPIDCYNWNFCHGALTKAKVEWTIKHVELANEIRKYTRPFKCDEENWYPYKDCNSSKMQMSCSEKTERPHEYGWFKSKNDIEKVIEIFGEEYILKFLFEPRDCNYKVIMKWLEEQEESDNVQD